MGRGNGENNDNNGEETSEPGSDASRQAPEPPTDTTGKKDWH